MKKLCINISLFFMLLTLSSCNDWLDEVKQTTTVSDEIIWQDETQVDKYVNSFYPLLHDYGQFGEAQFYGSFTESLTDAFKYGSYTLGHRAGHPNLYVLHRMLSLRITVYTVSGYVQQHTNRSEKQTNFYLYKENIPNFQQTEISFGKLKYAFSVHLYISS